MDRVLASVSSLLTPGGQGGDCDVADLQTFASASSSLAAMLADCDVAGLQTLSFAVVFLTVMLLVCRLCVWQQFFGCHVG